MKRSGEAGLTRQDAKLSSTLACKQTVIDATGQDRTSAAYNWTVRRLSLHQTKMIPRLWSHEIIIICQLLSCLHAQIGLLYRSSAAWIFNLAVRVVSAVKLLRPARLHRHVILSSQESWRSQQPHDHIRYQLKGLCNKPHLHTWWMCWSSLQIFIFKLKEQNAAAA